MAFDLQSWLATLLGSRKTPPNHLGLKYDPRTEAAAILAQLADRSTNNVLSLTDSYSGYVREGALRLLQQNSPSQEALSTIIRRLNDWVPAVRVAATECFLNYLRKEYLPFVLASLTNLLMLADKTRQDHSALLGSVRTALMQSPELVLTSFPEQKGRAARFLLEILVQSGVAQAWECALRHADPSVRTRAVAELALQSTNIAIPWLDHAMLDKHPRIRCAALRARLAFACDPNERLMLCQRLLLDSASSPRSAAAWYAEQEGMDVTGWYRQQLDTADASEALLHEVARRDLVDGVTLARQHQHDPRTRLRGLALLALLHLCPDEQDALVKQGLTDRSARIRDLVRKQLRTKITVDVSVLEDAFFTATHQGSAHGILAMFSSWRQIMVLLEWLHHTSSAEETNAAHTMLVNVCRHTQSLYWCQPSPEERLRIETVLTELHQYIVGIPELVGVLDKHGLWKS